MTIELPEIAVMDQATQEAQRLVVLDGFRIGHVAFKEFSWHRGTQSGKRPYYVICHVNSL